MRETFEDHIKKTFPELIKGRVLVACSGGLDSMVLTHLLHGMQLDMGLAHCNFGLRGMESDDDATFVEAIAEKLDVPVYIQRFETKQFAKDRGISTQMAARELRYAWFEEIRTDFKYDHVVTAHHLDDSLETVFINLSRGTGLRGLLGVPERNEAVVRPLLPFTRDALFQFAKAEAIHWREDSSNSEKTYLRNQVRHEVVPPFKELHEQWDANFRSTLKHLKDSHNLLEDYMALVMKLVVEEQDQGYAIRIEKLKELPHYDALLYELLHDFGFTAWEDVSQLLEAQSGKQILSKTHRLIKDRDHILLTELPQESQNFVKVITKSETQIETPLKMSFIPTDKMGYLDTNTIYVDSDQLQYPLVLRKWEEGDRFQPFGMQGKKKLSKFFKDEKLSLASKENTWVLWTGNAIVWIVGLRADDRFKVTPNTKNILKISVAE